MSLCKKKAAAGILCRCIAAVLMLAVLICIFSNALVYATAAPRTSTLTALCEAQEPSYDCILVLGAGLTPEGTPSRMLSDRLDIAVDLFRAGLSSTILVSGDRRTGYDEVTAMHRYLVEAGIDEQAIIEDGFGFSTGESVSNLADKSEAERVLIVTQAYHLPRALFLATAHGLHATGVAAKEARYKGQGYRDVRELIACVKDVLFVWF